MPICNLYRPSAFQRPALWISLVVLLLLSSCSKPLRMTLVGDANMNSVESQVGNAAQVHVYQLTHTTNFEQTPVESFWQDEQAALESELLGDPIQFVLYPNESERIELKLEKGAKYIGVAANFRHPNTDRWRDVLSVEDLRRKKQLLITIGSNHVTIRPQ